MTKSKSGNKHNLYLISDSSGNLLEHHINAILSQFPRDSFCIHIERFIETEDELSPIFKKIKSGLICYATINKSLQDKLVKEAHNRKIPSWDITTPTVEFIENVTGIKALNEINLVHRVDESYVDRMSALEFAFQHDDNRRIDQLNQAEIIIVGISRVSKSPNSLYLGYRGFKVANVTIVSKEELPKPLSIHRRKNVVALTIQPKKLAGIRQRRFSSWDIANFDYDDLTSVIHEVRDAEELYRKKKWPIIDVTNLTIEETSSMIMEKLKLKNKAF